MARPKKYGSELRTSLIHDAAQQIADGGTAALSLRPLAAAHGCSTTAIYTMFGSRDGLIAAVTEAAASSFRASQEAVGDTERPEMDLYRLGVTYRAWALENPALYEIIFGLALPESAEIDPAREAIHPLRRGLERCIEAKLLAPRPVEEIVLSVWAGVHGWVTLELQDLLHLSQDPDTAYANHLASLYRSWETRIGPF